MIFFLGGLLDEVQYSLHFWVCLSGSGSRVGRTILRTFEVSVERGSDPHLLLSNPGAEVVDFTGQIFDGELDK